MEDLDEGGFLPGDRVICMVGDLAGDIATVVDYSSGYSHMAQEDIYVILTEDSVKFWATADSLEKSIYQGEDLTDAA